MKSLNDYSTVQKRQLNELKIDLIQIDETLSKIGSAKLTVSDQYDVPALRLRINDRFPPQSVLDKITEYQMVMLMAYATEENNLVIWVGNPV